MDHHCWAAVQHPGLIYSLSSQHKAHWISPLISIRHLVLPLSLLAQQHTHTHTRTVLFAPPPNSVMQITGFVVCCQCVASTEIAGVCSVDALQQVLCWGYWLSLLGCTCLGLACVCARWLW